MKPRLKLFTLFLLTIFLFDCHKNNKIRPDHIVIVIEENRGYNEIIGSQQAPYINQLAKEGALFTNSHGVQHPSQPNYLALFSGSTQGIEGDECLRDSTPFTTPNLGAALVKAGLSFKGYAQTMPSVGYLPCYYKTSTLTKSPLYGRKHCPWVNWQGNKRNELPPSISHPFSDFPSNFSKLPVVSIVIPDMDHDMHNHVPGMGYASMIKTGDTWLKNNLSKYISWAQKHNSLFILTFDEEGSTLQNHIATIFVGPMVKTGKYDDSIDHYSVLRTIEAIYHLPPSGNAKEKPITNVWE